LASKISVFNFNDRALFRNKMKGYLILFIILKPAIFYSAFAQINDDFSDGNFNENPTWQGETSDFIINSNMQLQLNAAAENSQSYLSTTSEIINNAEWSFYVKLEFNPSSNNYMDIYLVSDNADLTAPINGYFVRIGNTQDEVSLYKQSGDKSSIDKIIDGMDDRVKLSTVELNIKITKNHEDEWELLVDTDLNQNFISEGTVMDSEHFFSRYFGIYCVYSATRSDKFFLDSLSITGAVFVDNEAPQMDSLLVLSDSSIQLFFNEKMMLSSISDLNNYLVNNGIGIPKQASISSDSSVILLFDEKFNDAVLNQISIQGVEDLFGNALKNLAMAFTYNAPYIIGFGDIIVSEIMADPTPGVDLPEYEYLEIHNPHPELFYLDQVTLIVGLDTTYLPNLTVEPFEYIILCQHAAVAHFENNGRTIKITNWPSLNNRGENIILINKNEEIVYFVEYEDSWYKSIEKDNGGYSLEMIDINFPCRGKENWIASIDPSGGTPGKENSVKDELIDLSASEIEKIIATSTTSVNLYLSENIGPQKIAPTDISITPELEIGNIDLQQPGFSEVQLELKSEISPKTVYHLALKNLADCAGNIQKETSSTFVLPETADSLDLIINELLFNPKPDGVDFVEIYNQSEKYIDLSSISLESDEFKPISVEHFIIEPKQFLAITEDPTTLNNHYPGIDTKNVLKSMAMPAFNNDAGSVFLLNVDGKQIDFFHYEEDYHSDFLSDTKGVSLERISIEGQSDNPNNWQSASSTAGFATPGKMNSQYLIGGDESEEVTIEPKVFDPGSSVAHDFTMIKCRFSTAGNMASIQILDATGRQIKAIISHQSIGAEEDFKWNGLDDNGNEVKMGPYIVFVEIYNSKGEKKLYRKKVVVGGRF